jgi:hypothetical protein
MKQRGAQAHSQSDTGALTDQCVAYAGARRSGKLCSIQLATAQLDQVTRKDATPVEIQLRTEAQVQIP